MLSRGGRARGRSLIPLQCSITVEHNFASCIDFGRQRDANAFYRQKGAADEYVELAAVNADLLVLKPP